MSESRKLGRHVTVAGTTYGPGDVVPDDIAAKIKNPKAWVPLDADGDEQDDGRGPAGTTSGDRLASSVTIGGKTYGPKDFIPDDVAAKITNPKAWMGGKLPAPAAQGSDASTAETEGAAGAKTPPPAPVAVPAPAADGPGASTADAKEATETKTKSTAPTSTRRP